MSSPTNSSATWDRSLVLNVCGGARICVPPNLGQATCYILLEQEDWFEDEIRFVRRWLRPGMRAIDVGASYGLYTVAMAQAVGREGRIWAFEPTPHTADFLSRTLELNGCSQVMVSRIALSDHGGVVAFSIKDLSELNAVAAAGSSSPDIVAVPAATLDHLALRYEWNDIDFVKLDVEGHELQAIRGGAGFFRSGSPLVMFEIKSDDRFELNMLEPLAEFDYDFYRLLPGLLVLSPFDRDQAIDEYQLNLFACKPDRAAQLAADGFLDDHGQSARLATQDWAKYVEAAPYARGLAGGWPAKAGFFGASIEKTYLKGLAAFAGSRDAGISASARCALLGQAMQYVAEATAVGAGLAQGISCARLAWETGQRKSAVDRLSHALGRLEGEGARALAEPFLAPGMRYERVAMDGRPRDWLRCAVTEQFEKLRAYSSMFVEEKTSTVLGSVIGLPFCSPEMERRRQLMRMATGAQQAPEAAPGLRVRSEENLNPEFWCGTQRA